MLQRIRIIHEDLHVSETFMVIVEELPSYSYYSKESDKQWIAFANKFHVDIWDRKWYDLYLRICGEGMYDQIINS